MDVWKKGLLGKYAIGLKVLLLYPALLGAVLGQMQVDTRRQPQVAELFETTSGDEKLACAVAPLPPVTTFGFRIQAGYLVAVPLKQVSGSGQGFAVALRVTPENGAPAYFLQSARLPKVPDRVKAQWETSGGVLLGAGKYSVDLAVVDRSDRVCRKHWTWHARLSGRARNLEERIPPGTAQPLSALAWRGAQQAVPKPLRVAVLFHAAPLFFRSTRIRTFDRTMLLSSLAAILEELPVTSVRLTAFNLMQQRELLTREEFDEEGFADLASTLSETELGTIDVSVLMRRTGHLHLLARLLNDALTSQEPADVVILLSTPVRQMDKMPEVLLAPVARRPLVYHLELKPYWPLGKGDFPDTLAHAAKALGGKTFRIRMPSELAAAIEKIQHDLGLGPK